MKVYNTTTKETVEFTLIDEKTNTEWTQDAIQDDTNIVYNGKLDRYEANTDTCKWWVEYSAKMQLADTCLTNFLKNADDVLVHEEFQKYITGVDFNDYPEAMLHFIEEHK